MSASTTAETPPRGALLSTGKSHKDVDFLCPPTTVGEQLLRLGHAGHTRASGSSAKAAAAPGTPQKVRAPPGLEFMTTWQLGDSSPITPSEGGANSSEKDQEGKRNPTSSSTASPYTPGALFTQTARSPGVDEAQAQLGTDSVATSASLSTPAQHGKGSEPGGTPPARPPGVLVPPMQALTAGNRKAEPSMAVEVDDKTNRAAVPPYGLHDIDSDDEEAADAAVAAAMEASRERGELGSPEVPTLGSIGHLLRLCKPCAFVNTKGCKDGISCKFCHLCEPGEKKRRKKEKSAFWRALNRWQQGQEALQCQAASMSWA